MLHKYVSFYVTLDHIFCTKYVSPMLHKYVKKCLWHCCIFAPPQWFGAQAIVPPAPSLCPSCYAIKIGKFSEHKQIFRSECHELLFHEHLQFSNTIQHGSCTVCQRRLLAAFQVSSCSLCHFYACSNVFRRRPVFVLLESKTFPTFNKWLL